MPEGGLSPRPRQEILSFDEITRIAGVAHELGVRSVRFTGGEPLLRRGIVELIGQVTEIGFDDVALTTNGTYLAPLASALADAGLRRVNVSCDSLRPDRFSQIRRRGNLSAVLHAMNVAEAAGLVPLKVNVVVIAGINDDEILDFAEFARRQRRIVRFIEYMPLDADRSWRRDQVVSGDDVVARINEKWPLEPASFVRTGTAPADSYRFTDGGGEIGVVASVTRPFCGTCDRIRLTADGAIRNCLFSDNEVSIRDIIRDGGTDSDVASALRRAVWAKKPGHGINDPGFLRPIRSMSMIGG
jgi:cyclic pyranopterin phosphate synthase